MKEPNEDKLTPARGIMNGCLLSLALWGWIIVACLLGWLIAKGF